MCTEVAVTCASFSLTKVARADSRITDQPPAWSGFVAGSLSPLAGAATSRLTSWMTSSGSVSSASTRPQVLRSTSSRHGAGQREGTGQQQQAVGAGRGFRPEGPASSGRQQRRRGRGRPSAGAAGQGPRQDSFLGVRGALSAVGAAVASVLAACLPQPGQADGAAVNDISRHTAALKHPSGRGATTSRVASV